MPFNRSVVEVLPESMAAERGCKGASSPPSILERAFGVLEKTGECTLLPPLFTLREKAVIRTHRWLSPVVYSIDSRSGAIVVRDVLAPAPYAEYVVDTIGGERVRKYVDVGVVYVSAKSIRVDVGEEIKCFTQERIPITVKLRWARLRVSDLPRMLVELWKKQGDLDPAYLLDELKTVFARVAEERVAVADADVVFVKKGELRRGILEGVRRPLSCYGLDLEDLDVETYTEPEYFEYYFWHKVNELPIEYAYALYVMRRAPKHALSNSPEPVLALVLAALARRHPGILRALLGRARH